MNLTSFSLPVTVVVDNSTCLFFAQNKTENEGEVIECSSFEVSTEGNPSPSPGYLIDDATAEIILAVNSSLLCGLLSIFGISTNVINIIVFLKLGFRETINISLLSLAVSDLCALLTLLWLGFTYNPFLPFNTMAYVYLTAGWPHGTFSRITVWITAFVTFERLLCVAVPFKVKAILTPKKVTFINVFIFVASLGSASPIYYTTRYGWIHYPAENRSVLGLWFTKDRDRIDNIVRTLNTVVSPLTAFVVVVSCTIALVVKLKQSAKFRQNAGKTQQDGQKNIRVATMMTAISTIFIICFTPTAISCLCVVTIPGFNVAGNFRNIYLVLFAISFLFGGINSSVNIFVYYRMSGNYKTAFLEVMKLNQKGSK